nr:hypothetical protein BaRGS_026070 [Batillaria attramentaria]
MSMLVRKGTMIRHGRNTVRKSHLQRGPQFPIHTGGTSCPLQPSNSKLRDQLLHSGIRPGSFSRSQETDTAGLSRDQSDGHHQELLEAQQHTPAYSVVRPICDDQINQHADLKELGPHYEHDDLYQAAANWHRSSVEQSERSEVLQQVLEANKDADGACDFVCRFTDVISTTMASTVLLFLTLVLPVAMITMGVKYLDDCPLERRVPVFLLVGGCFGALKLLGMLWKNVQIRRYESMDEFYDSPDSELAFTSRTFRMMDWILSAFLLTWHVVGAFWVFALWRPPFSPSLHEPNNYCGTTVYMFAVSEIVFVGVVLTLLLLYCLVLALCYKYTTLFEK